MGMTITYNCSTCKKELEGSRNNVGITHRPPDWPKRMSDKYESYYFCDDCYLEFLDILHRRTTDDVCHICRFSYCCEENPINECSAIEEFPKKTFIDKFLRR